MEMIRFLNQTQVFKSHNFNLTESHLKFHQLLLLQIISIILEQFFTVVHNSRKIISAKIQLTPFHLQNFYSTHNFNQQMLLLLFLSKLTLNKNLEAPQQESHVERSKDNLLKIRLKLH